MKKILLLALLTFTSTIVFGQTAYIQVTGESGLSVYLNNQYKGKTAAEYNGYIIENVPAGKNLIKIVKEGFTPFEETLTIKPGEVFAYKVKPFTKHTVKISEQGNTGQTENKASVETGKLIIQSVPIEIRITMPGIEGISNSAKTKDEWIADKILAGSYTINFTYNQKTVTKTVEISGNETTSVFVNMLSGDFKSKNSLDEKLEKQRIEKRKHSIVSGFIDSLTKEYRFKERLTETEFRNYNSAAAKMMTSKNRLDTYKNTYRFADGKAESHSASYVSFDSNDDLVAYSYNIIKEKNKVTEILEYYKNIKALIEALIPAEFIRKGDTYISVYYPRMNIEIQYNINVSSLSKTHSLSIFFLVIDR